MLGQTLRLPAEFLCDFHLSIARIVRRDGLKGIQCAAIGMLRDMRGRHRLTGSTCSQTSRFIFIFYIASSRMCRQGSSPDIGHAKHAGANPFSTCFDGFAGPIILRIRPFKKGEHALGAICRPGCHRFLVFFAVFFINGLSHGLYREP